MVVVGNSPVEYKHSEMLTMVMPMAEVKQGRGVGKRRYERSQDWIVAYAMWNLFLTAEIIRQWWYSTGSTEPVVKKILPRQAERRKKSLDNPHRIGPPTRSCAFLFFIISADWHCMPQLVCRKLCVP
uniref:PiggyBac transposable element-derived protein domain-containing protein n=1 Tax=Micrurus corallinus TaxID=54390 RepID=A0A2D4FEL7_MICCO